MGACCSKGKSAANGLLACRGRRDAEHETAKLHDFTQGEETDGARVRLRGSSDYASMNCQQGWKGVNQDAMTIWEDFGGEAGRVFCGVFDGHGPYGHRAASYIRDNLPLKLSSSLQFNETQDQTSTDELCEWKSAFFRAFEDLDKELSEHAAIDCVCSGTTAVSVIKQGEHLMIANLGDSRAILCARDDDDTLVAVQLTIDLKPNLPSEAERITSCRGRVFALEEEPDVHRIWLPDEDSPGLAMARAFGDFCLKDFGLISTPQVSCRKLTDKDEFVVLATDGVWDVLSNTEVVKIVSSAAKRSEAAKLVVQQAVRSWRTKYPSSKVDDCTVVCLFLKPPPPVLSAKSSFGSSRHRDFSFCDSFKTIKLEESFSELEEVAVDAKDGWSALEGLSRANSLIKVPRFAGLATVLSWRKKSVKVVEED